MGDFNCDGQEVTREVRFNSILIRFNSTLIRHEFDLIRQDRALVVSFAFFEENNATYDVRAVPKSGDGAEPVLVSTREVRFNSILIRFNPTFLIRH